jgi:hypothetical protein
MSKLPIARSADIVVQEFDEEILIYDLGTHKIHSLNQTSSIVYRHCDGKTTFAELKQRYKFTDDLIHLALDQLREANLIEIDSQTVSPFNGMNRRTAIRRVGLASMIALPFITSLVAPRAVDAQTSTCNLADPGGTGGSGRCGCPNPTPANTTCGVGGIVRPPCNEGCLCKTTGICFSGASGFCGGDCI